MLELITLIMCEIEAYDGSKAALKEDTLEHILRKHSEMIKLLGLTKSELIEKIFNILKAPGEVYRDAREAKYFIKKLNNLYLNVIMHDGIRMQNWESRYTLKYTYTKIKTQKK